MFETVAPEVRSRRVAYETLPVSIALHAAALGGGVILALWTVALPTHSPRLTRAYVLVADPPLPAAITPKDAPPPVAARLSTALQFNPNLLVLTRFRRSRRISRRRFSRPRSRNLYRLGFLAAALRRESSAGCQSVKMAACTLAAMRRFLCTS